MRNSSTFGPVYEYSLLLKCQDSTLTLGTAKKLHPAPPSRYDDIDADTLVDLLAPNLEGERSSKVFPYQTTLMFAIAAPMGPRKQPLGSQHE